MYSVNNRDEDRTARARIRDAAIACFAARGVDGTSLKTIAEEAEVSQGLILHHFGTKQGLRTACDEYTVATIQASKTSAMGQGPQMDPLAAMRAESDGPPVLEYLARTLADGSPEVAALVDGIVEAGHAALDEGVKSGMLKPIDQPREVAIVLTLWSLGLLTLHRHAERLLGVDITGPVEDRARYVRVAMEALGRGLFTDEAYQHAYDALSAQGEEEEGHHE